MEKIEAYIKYHDPALLPVEQAHNGEWFDLRAAEDVFISVGEFAMIPLGISMQLPEGYEAMVIPRSSTFGRYGLIMTNGVGLIDCAYNGDDDQWWFPCYCLKGKNYDPRKGQGTQIHKNDRICQFRIQKQQPTVQLLEVSKLSNENRGGFGSTGRN